VSAGALLAFVIASAAKQSMPGGAMDCFVGFASSQ
jgi:hypothetical protein